MTKSYFCFDANKAGADRFLAGETGTPAADGH
jgi:hypothetical protein